MAFGWKIGPIAEHQGEAIELVGLQPAQLDDPAVVEELNALWLRHGVIVFRGISDAATHVRLSRCFGECQLHPVRQINTEAEFPELTNVQYGPGNPNGSIYRVNGVERGAWLPLHFDLVYVDVVNHGGLLRPITIPETGGATLFLDKIALYDTLPDDMREEIGDLEILYRFSVELAQMRFGTDQVEKIVMGAKFVDIESRAHLFPRSIHPLVYAQAGSGRKMLNLSPWFADAIVGREDEAGDALLGRLCAHVQASPDIYAHRWREGDLVLWDNWRMLHGAEGVAPDASRWLQRTTITGDYALGRLETHEVASDELRTVDV
jgi:taurine dioxygenase